MTAHSKSKPVPETYSSSRDWAESVLQRIKQIQDEYLDYYNTDKKEATNMLKVLNKLVELVEKKLS